MFSGIADKLGKDSHLRTDTDNQNSSTPVNLSRRGFLGGSSIFVVGITLASCAKAEEVVIDPTPPAPAGPSPLTEIKGGDATPSLWIEIQADGKIKVTCHRSEMGQQAWTAMSQIVVEELEGDWKDVEIVQALGHPKYGDQNTDGSRSVRYNFHRLRVAGAAMRAMLTQAAANHWKVDPSECLTEQGVVSLKGSNKSLTYGKLAEAAGNLQVPSEEEITLKKREDWRLIGQEISSLTVEKIVKGEGTFGQDVQRPDMVYAVIAHPPQLFGSIKSIDDTDTMAMKGVLKTVKLPDLTAPPVFKALGGVAVIASDTWAAIQGRDGLNIEWNKGPNAGFDSEAYFDVLSEAAKGDGSVIRSRGDVKSALNEVATPVLAEYRTAFLSHSPIEPPSATAEWTGDELECWACVQDPQTTRKTLSDVLGLDIEKIKVNATWLGGAFGRKSKCDFVVEAAILSKEVGKPVKVVWTREDEMQFGYYHAMSVQRFEGGLDENGKCVAYQHKTAFPSIQSTFNANAKGPGTFEVDLGGTDVAFDVPNLEIQSIDAQAGVRIGWLRSVSNIHHVFGNQSYAAELAAAAGRDPKDYLLELIGKPRIIDLNGKENAKYANYGGDPVEYPIDTARLLHVAERVSEMADWGRELPKGHGLGIAVHRSFLSYVATVIEVAVSEEGELKIIGCWSVIDAGTVVNPLHVRAQTEGGTIFGISNALYGKITVSDGVVDQVNFPDWRLLRMNEAPHHFEVEVVESNAPPAGVGEPAVPPAAPALANAIFAATGKRFRTLPIIGPDEFNLPLNNSEDA